MRSHFTDRAITKIGEICLTIMFLVCLTPIVLAGVVFVGIGLLGGKHVHYKYTTSGDSNVLSLTMDNETSRSIREKGRKG